MSEDSQLHDTLQRRRARGYVRLSQSSERSIDDQKEDIITYCEENNLELSHIYDEGEQASGWDESRKEYQQMLDDARAGEFDVLVVRDASRLGRDKKERFRQFLNLDAMGVEFHTKKRGYVDPDDPKEFIFEAVTSTSDDEGKGAEVERLTKAIEKKVENGHYHGAPKFGTCYSGDKTSLVANEEFQTAIDVLNFRMEGKTYREIESETGCDLAKIKRILDNETVYRTIGAEGRWTPGMVETLIEEA